MTASAQPGQPSSEPRPPTASSRSSAPVHAFDDELAGLDGVATAAAIRAGELSRREVLDAAVRRARRVDAELCLVESWDVERALASAGRPVPGPFSGVPTFVKDNTDVAGVPTGHGSEAFEPHPARADAPFTRVLRQLGLVPLGKSRLPEFGFNATTEFLHGAPARNPWDPTRSTGASSGGSAGLVAAGVVPLAHANDGGGSIRIPAAACGLVGLKPSRGRFVPNPLQRVLPIDIVGEGVLTRTVRDTAHAFAHAERRARQLPPVGLVEGASDRRLRIAVVVDSVTGTRTADETRAAVLGTAELLSSLGHEVSETTPPVDAGFADDFALYWALLGYLMTQLGPRLLPGLNRDRLDTLTLGLADHLRAHRRRLPGAIRRLRGSSATYARVFERFDVVLTPVVAAETPELGHLSPRQPFDVLFPRLVEHVAFTPVNNAAGTPAISLPLARTGAGLPIGVHLMAAAGEERTLLELAYELEGAVPFARLGPAGPPSGNGK